MAGLSSRFFSEGYDRPKYMLEAHGKYLFDHALNSFGEYFESEDFLFIVREAYSTPEFVKSRANELGIKKFHITVLEEPTLGQAETVMLGLTDYGKYDGSITIFNIDTFRPGFKYPKFDESIDGYLEVFRGLGDNWSFAKPYSEFSTKVKETAEKKVISDLCSTGLYYFSTSIQFTEAYKKYIKLPKEEWVNGELYIAPLYNLLISDGANIHYHEIHAEDVIFCGVPAEYLDFRKRKYPI